MALPAPKLDRDWPAAAPMEGRADDIHDPVAQMQQTLAATLRLDASNVPLGPVEQLLRYVSRTVGWTTLAAAAIVTVALVL